MDCLYIETYQRSFERCHPRPLRPPLPRNWGFATPTRNSNRKSRKTSAHIEWNSLQAYGIFQGGQCGHSRGPPQFFGLPPINSRTGKATDFKFGRYETRIRSCIRTIKPFKSFGEDGALWAYPGTVEIFWVGYSLLSQERLKRLSSNFVGTFMVSIGTKAHENFWELQLWAQSGSPENFQGTPIYSGCIARSSLRQHSFLVYPV